MKVISGMQTGADIGGIKAAKDTEFETGGYMPKGYRTEKGNKPEYKDLYGALEHSSTDYLGRTLKNVMISDCTIIFDYMQSSGSKNTKMYCAKNSKTYLYLNAKKIDSNEVVNTIVEFITIFKPCVLNIAGNRESVCSGIGDKVYKIMGKVFLQLKI